jgi:hypothetical protein
MRIRPSTKKALPFQETPSLWTWPILNIVFKNHIRLKRHTVSTWLGAAGQIKPLVFDPLVHPNEGMGNFPGLVRVETVS